FRSALPGVLSPAIVLFPELSELPLETYHCERSARRIAAFVLLLRASSHPCLSLVVHSDNAVADRQLARHRKIHQSAGGLMRNNIEMDRGAAKELAKRNQPHIGPT